MVSIAMICPTQNYDFFLMTLRSYFYDQEASAEGMHKELHAR